MSLNNPANPLKVSGGAAVSFDDTMTESNGVYSVTRPVHPILTQAEYDALPEDEKNKGVYVVSDGEDAGEESGSTGPGEVYSEEETVIGTFLGKPLYRKVYTVYNIVSAANYQSIAKYSTQIEPVNLHGVIVKVIDGYRCVYVIPQVSMSSNTIQNTLVYNGTNGFTYVNTNSLLAGGTLYATLEYTKTTD